MGSLAQNSSGGIRCSCNTRFRRRFRRVPEGWWGSAGFRRVPGFWRGSGADGRQVLVQLQARFRRVPVQMADEVSISLVQTIFWRVPDGWWGSEGSGADSKTKVAEVSGHIADKVPEGSGTKPSKIFQTVGDSALVYFFFPHALLGSSECSKAKAHLTLTRIPTWLSPRTSLICFEIRVASFPYLVANILCSLSKQL